MTDHESIERQILAMLPAHATNSIDRKIILDGIMMGFLPSHVDVNQNHPYDVDVRWLRFRAACARAESRMHPEMAVYLRHRAASADREASAMELSFAAQPTRN